MHIEH